MLACRQPFHGAADLRVRRSCVERLAATRRTPTQHAVHARRRAAAVAVRAALQALIFDCDGVIVESEDIHRLAYNEAFEHFNVCCDGRNVVDWTVEFYDMLQNKVGGGKPKMRWYFGENGWPTSSVLNGAAPTTDEEKSHLIDVLQDWKTEKYKDIIRSGQVKPRDGVLQLLDEARTAGLKVAVCSAATKSSVVLVVSTLLGQERFDALDCFLAGDDVKNKKPDPLIYRVAADKMGVEPSRCIVVEDSAIGLQAARGAGMKCIITYTHSTSSQSFDGADCIVGNLADVTLQQLMDGSAVKDDRVAARA